MFDKALSFSAINRPVSKRQCDLCSSITLVIIHTHTHTHIYIYIYIYIYLYSLQRHPNTIQFDQCSIILALSLLEIMRVGQPFFHRKSLINLQSSSFS